MTPESSHHESITDSMVALLRFDLKRLAKSKSIYVTLLLLVVMVCHPIITFQYTFSELYFNDSGYVVSYIPEMVDSGLIDSIPEDLRARALEENDAWVALETAKQNRDDKGHLEAVIRLEKIRIANIKQGYSSEKNPFYNQFKLAFLEGLYDRGIYDIYEVPCEMPGVCFVPWSISKTPYYLWMIPAALIYSAIFSSARRSRSRQLDSLLPINLVVLSILRLVTGPLVSLVTILLSLIPAFIWATVSNGIGRLDYSVATVVKNQIVICEAGQYLLMWVLLVTLACLFVGTIVLLTTRFSDRRMIAIVSAAVVVLIPSLSSYFAVNPNRLSFMNFLPTSYFDFTQVIGGFSVPPPMLAVIKAVASFGEGMPVMLGWTIIVAGVAIAHSLITRKV
ncbi:MAG: hypothetical protein LBU61_02545 [Coriobacteriales bacterium]|jgi:hypothetical protein|nr:hypothetical protein [Coriobacteriales bacterium]